MKQGIKTIQNLYGELERQRAARKDLIADTQFGKWVKYAHRCNR